MSKGAQTTNWSRNIQNKKDLDLCEGLTGSADFLKVPAALAMDETVVVTVTDLSTGVRLATSASAAACTQQHKLPSAFNLNQVIEIQKI